VLGLAEHIVDEAFAPIGKKSRWIGNGDVGFTKVEDGPALGDGEGGEVVNFFLASSSATGMGRGGKCPGGTGGGTGISSVDSVGTVVSYRKKDFR